MAYNQTATHDMIEDYSSTNSLSACTQQVCGVCLVPLQLLDSLYLELELNQTVQIRQKLDRNGVDRSKILYWGGAAKM